MCMYIPTRGSHKGLLLSSHLLPPSPPLTLVDEDNLPSVYLRLCEVEDLLLWRPPQGHRPADWHLHRVEQLLGWGVCVLGGEHAGGDVSRLSGNNLQHITSHRVRSLRRIKTRHITARRVSHGRDGWVRRLQRPSVCLLGEGRKPTQVGNFYREGKCLSAASCGEDKVMVVAGVDEKYEI